MSKIFFHTFGCKVNQCETESIRKNLLKAGYQLTDKISQFDVGIINSCTVTAEADRKCRQFIRKILRENPSGRLLVTGCYATRKPEEIKRISPQIEVFFNRQKDSIPGIISGCSLSSSVIENSLLLSSAISSDCDILLNPLSPPLQKGGIKGGLTCLSNSSSLLKVTALNGRTRAFVKVQDGCNATCTYCIIPKVRPEMKSRSSNEILAEVKMLLEQGYQEIVLTGIRLGSYGFASNYKQTGNSNNSTILEKSITPSFSPFDPFSFPLTKGEHNGVTRENTGRLENSRVSGFDPSALGLRTMCESNPYKDCRGDIHDARQAGNFQIPIQRDSLLVELLRRIIDLPGTFRIRLSSLEITEITDELITLAHNSKKICRHFHLPLQSGDDTILKKMGRWYDTHFFSERIAQIRKSLSDVGLTTDVIVGFPGESEENFQNTYQFLENHFNGMHVFPFSLREGTSAVKLPYKCDPAIIRDRAKKLIALAKHLRKDFQNRFAGKKRMVLAETDGGFTDNGIRIPSPLPFPNGEMRMMTIPRASSPTNLLKNCYEL